MEVDTEVVTGAAGMVAAVGTAVGAGTAAVVGMAAAGTAAVFASHTSIITVASSMAATIRLIIPIIITAAE